jgi:hypothetical protein
VIRQRADSDAETGAIAASIAERGTVSESDDPAIRDLFVVRHETALALYHALNARFRFFRSFNDEEDSGISFESTAG